MINLNKNTIILYLIVSWVILIVVRPQDIIYSHNDIQKQIIIDIKKNRITDLNKICYINNKEKTDTKKYYMIDCKKAISTDSFRNNIQKKIDNFYAMLLALWLIVFIARKYIR